ncbi:MAG: hypothetical protein EBT13_13985 [Rhodobacteraceae bacterium]|nr:hypothetical protein [Paracoccaceae bacterium]
MLAEAALGDMITTGKPAAYFAPTYKMLMEVWRTIKRDFRDVIAETNESEKRITYINGGQLDMWSLDNFDAVRGRKYGRVIIDEAAMVPDLEEAWTMAIRPTLSDYRGDAWFFSTPKGRNYFYHLAERAKTDEVWTYWQMPTSANPFIAADEIDAARLELPSTVFAQEYLAEFIDVQGALIKREMITYMDASSVPSGLKIGMGAILFRYDVCRRLITVKRPMRIRNHRHPIPFGQRGAGCGVDAVFGLVPGDHQMVGADTAQMIRQCSVVETVGAGFVDDCVGCPDVQRRVQFPTGCAGVKFAPGFVVPDE